MSNDLIKNTSSHLFNHGLKGGFGPGTGWLLGPGIHGLRPRICGLCSPGISLRLLFEEVEKEGPRGGHATKDQDGHELGEKKE